VHILWWMATKFEGMPRHQKVLSADRCATEVEEQ